MDQLRRKFFQQLGAGLAGAAALGFKGSTTYAIPQAEGKDKRSSSLSSSILFDVRTYGAKGDGKTIDSPAINLAIEKAAAAGGGTVYFPAGTYASYSIRLKSYVSLYLEQGATILAAKTPDEGTTTGGYDVAEPNTAWDAYQDYGHNHWHNSLIWGENIHDVSILGPGLIWGEGLSRGFGKPRAEAPGVGNKAIALKNCHNVLLKDFSILKGGHFGILATGVDNFTIDNLKIDTDRDGMDIDCCRNVRVSNCSVNSPWDDGICPKSSFALGYARATENVSITNCYVTAAYEMGTMLDGTWKRLPAVGETKIPRTGRIKCGTESNGGFKNITVSNCIFDGCAGIALESVDGALLEDITFTGITMRDITNTPFFLRLGARMRGPAGVPVGTCRRIILSNIVSYNSVSTQAGLILGIPGHPIEDVKISDVYLHHVGGGTSQMASIQPPELENGYPEPKRFGPMPSHGFFVRHVNNIEFTNVEIACEKPDARPVFYLKDVKGVDFFRLKTPRGNEQPTFVLDAVEDFRILASRGLKDSQIEKAEHQQI